MAVTITTEMFCDGCANWQHVATGRMPQKALAHAKAKAAGWTQKVANNGSVRCLCPMCNGTQPGYWDDRCGGSRCGSEFPSKP